MSNYTSTYSIDFNEMKFVDENSDFTKSSEFDSLIQEKEGSFIKDGQYMAFNYLGIEVVVGFDVVVTGSYEFDGGDYNTAPYSEAYIDDVDIEINDIFIDEYEVELTKDIVDIFKKLIDKNL